jgi:hypothetical protein
MWLLFIVYGLRVHRCALKVSLTLCIGLCYFNDTVRCGVFRDCIVIVDVVGLSFPIADVLF